MYSDILTFSVNLYIIALMDLNALNWSEGARVIVVFIWVSSMAFGVIACSSIEDTKD